MLLPEMLQNGDRSSVLWVFDAPFADTDKAISSVNQLNLDTLTHFQQIKELRDSVALMNKLEKQTANPGSS